MYLKQDTFRINAGWGQASPPPQSISFAVKLCKAKCSDRQGLASSTSHHSLSTLGLLLLQKSTRKWKYINQSSYKERDLIKKTGQDHSLKIDFLRISMAWILFGYHYYYCKHTSLSMMSKTSCISFSFK